MSQTPTPPLRRFLDPAAIPLLVALLVLVLAAAWLWIIVLAGYGLAKLLVRDFSLRERAGWSFLFVLSGGK